MVRIYFDSETTGLVDHSKPFTDATQPHLVELAAQVWDDARGHKLAELNTLIRPDGWTMPPEAEAIHGITLAECEAHGIPLFKALSLFSMLVLCAQEVVVQNQVFEWAMQRISAARATGILPLLGFLSTRIWRDTTKMGGAAFPDLPVAGHGHGPRQSAIFERLHGCQPEGKHRAMGDVRTLRVNFLALESILSNAAEIPPVARPTGGLVLPSIVSAAPLSGSDCPASAEPAGKTGVGGIHVLAGAKPTPLPAPETLSHITRSEVCYPPIFDATTGEEVRP